MSYYYLNNGVDDKNDYFQQRLDDLYHQGGGILHTSQNVYKVAPSTQSWTPAEIDKGTLGVWFDADDPSTLTLSGSDVSDWNDKSGNARHATQATGANQPVYVASGINGRGSLRFDGTNEFMLTSDLNMGAGNSMSGFAVVSINLKNIGTSDEHVIFSDGIFNSEYSMRIGESLTGALQLTIRSSTNDGYARSPATLSAGTHFLAYTDVSENVASVRVNGLLEASRTVDTIPQTRAYGIGGSVEIISPTNRRLNGDLGELIVFRAKLSDYQRQQVEGYLAHKWGLTQNLPVNHLFKSEPPLAKKLDVITPVKAKYVL